MKHKNAFTLLEMIIVIAIIAVMGILLANIIVNSSGLSHQQYAKVQQGIGANDALSAIKNNLKVSQSVATGYPVSSPIYLSSNSVIVFKVPSVDNNEDVISDLYDYYIYHIDGQNLKEKVFPDALSSRKSMDRVLSNNVKSILFEYFDSTNQVVSPSNAEKVVITLILEQKAGFNREQNIATAEAYLLNN